MSHIQLFIDSLIRPKNLAKYRVLGVGKVLQYTFLLILIVTIFSFGQFDQNMKEQLDSFEQFNTSANDMKWIIYPASFIVLFILTTSIQFLKVSLYAFVGWLFLKPLKRRGEYRHIWRTATFAITWATVLSIVFTIFQLTATIWTIVGMFITILFIFIAIHHYPKLKS